MIKNTQKALSFTLKVIATLFALFIVLLVVIHFKIQKSTREKVEGYIGDSAIASNLEYKNIGKNYFPPAINISDVTISNSFGCFDNSIASVVIKNSGGIKLKGVNFDVINAVKCRFSKDSKKDFTNYMKNYKAGWDTINYPWLSLMLAGYRDVSSDIELSFDKKTKIETGQFVKNFKMTFFVQDALQVDFDVWYMDDAQNSIDNQKVYFIDSFTKSGEINTAEISAFFIKFAEVAKISSLSIVYKDMGFIDKYRVFVDKLALEVPDEPMRDDYIVKFGVFNVVQDMLENGLSLEFAEKIEQTLKDFVSTPDELYITSVNEKPVALKGTNWMEIMSSYIVDAKVNFEANN